jgi:hypothetical protein
MLSGLEQWSYTSYAGADGGLANGNTAAVIDLIPSHHGFEITLEQTGGTNRAYPWQLFVRAPT